MKKLFALFISAAISIGAHGATLLGPGQINPAGSTAGQAIVSTGPSGQPAWGGVPVSGLAAIAANSVIANATNASAIPTAVTVTGCNGAAQALQWTNGSGFGCNSAIATSGANSNITSLSGLTTPLPVTEGGTGRATLSSRGVLIGEGTVAINQTVAGTTGQMLIGATGTDPAFGNTISTLVATGTITPSSTAGIVGTITNDSAQAGSIGETITNSATAVSLTTATPANVTSINLTAGQWLVFGTGSIAAAGSTTVQNAFVGSSSTSATLGAYGTYWNSFGGQSVTAAAATYAVPTTVYKLAGSTTIFCVANVSFAVSTLTASCSLTAVRPR